MKTLRVVSYLNQFFGQLGGGVAYARNLVLGGRS